MNRKCLVLVKNILTQPHYKFIGERYAVCLVASEVLFIQRALNTQNDDAQFKACLKFAILHIDKINHTMPTQH